MEEKACGISYPVWHHHQLLCFTDGAWLQFAQNHSAHVLMRQMDEEQVREEVFALINDRNNVLFPVNSMQGNPTDVERVQSDLASYKSLTSTTWQEMTSACDTNQAVHSVNTKLSVSVWREKTI